MDVWCHHRPVRGLLSLKTSRYATQPSVRLHGYLVGFISISVPSINGEATRTVTRYDSGCERASQNQFVPLFNSWIVLTQYSTKLYQSSESIVILQSTMFVGESRRGYYHMIGRNGSP